MLVNQKPLPALAVKRRIEHRLCDRICATTSPLIVVGMHRSGTGLLVDLLERCGVQMGVDQDNNKESFLFQKLNIFILDFLGYGWRCLEHPSVAELLDRYSPLEVRVHQQLRERLLSQHLGFTALRLLKDPKIRWGWKDPRNSLTLPLWFRVFPQATVIHIYRDGRDAALSLMSREARKRGVDPSKPDERMIQEFLADIKLWELYINRIREGMNLFDRHYTLKYEALLAKPESEMGKLVESINIPLKASLADVVSIIDSSRSKRYEQRKFSWIHTLDIDSPLLKELGYEYGY